MLMNIAEEDRKLNLNPILILNSEIGNLLQKNQLMVPKVKQLYRAQCNIPEMTPLIHRLNEAIVVSHLLQPPSFVPFHC